MCDTHMPRTYMCVQMHAEVKGQPQMFVLWIHLSSLLKEGSLVGLKHVDKADWPMSSRDLPIPASPGAFPCEC